MPTCKKVCTLAMRDAVKVKTSTEYSNPPSESLFPPPPPMYPAEDTTMAISYKNDPHIATMRRTSSTDSGLAMYASLDGGD